MRTNIVCLGNELVGDDGVGIRVGRILRSLPLPETITVELVPNLGFGLLDALERAERLIIVDAMSTGRLPGSLLRTDLATLPEGSTAPACGHLIGIADIVTLARKLASDGKAPEVHVLGIEGRRFTDFGPELSPEVAAALPAAVDEVLQLALAPPALRALARPACTRWMEQPPSIAEICNP